MGNGMTNAIAQMDALELSPLNAKKTVSEIAMVLQDVLTQRLAAYMVGLSDGRDIGRYARNDRSPHFGTITKLRALFDVVTILNESEDEIIIRSWFLGMNPELNDRAPASLLHSDFYENLNKVKQAATKFVILNS